MQLAARFRTRVWLILLCGLAYGYFYSGGGWNQASRLDLARAILEEGRLTIDSYRSNTGDRAYHRGHYYSDKAPGTSFVVLPALAATRAAIKWMGTDPKGVEALRIQYRVATLAGAGVPSAILCLAIFGWMQRRGSSRAAALYAALAAGLASPLWVYATLLWGSGLACCCMVMAVVQADRLVRASPHERKGTLALSVGLWAGAAVVTEYPTFPMAAYLALWLFWELRPWSSYWRRLLACCAGAALMASVLASYNYLAFGSPFHIGYASVQGFQGMKRGVFGVTWPTWEAIAGVTWGPRGLLGTAPLLVLGVFGHVLSMVRRRQTRTAALLLFFSLYPYLLNVSYAYWDGGWSYGPRHMATALPFLAMGLAPLYDSFAKPLRLLAFVALAAGVFITLVGVSVHGMTSDHLTRPLLGYYLPAFVKGHYALHVVHDQYGGRATNFGLAMGLPVQYSLFPLGVLAAALLWGLARSLRRTKSALPQVC